MVLCICGKTPEAHGQGKSDHPHTPPAWGQSAHGTPAERFYGEEFGTRDDQYPSKVHRARHYQVVDYRIITIPKPAAGVDAKAVVPGCARWRVQSLQAQLLTSAAIANRIPHLVITDGQGNSVYNFPAAGNQVAGLTVQYTAGADIVPASGDGATTLVLPFPVKLLQGWTIGFVTTALDVADQWSNLALHCKEWLNF